MASGARRLLAGGTVAALILTAGLLAGCGPNGGTVKVESSFGYIVFTARPGKNNVVTVSLSGGDLLIHDGGDAISPGTGCTAVDAGTARCSGTGGIVLELGDGNDVASNNTSISSSVTGARGIEGGPGNDVLNGGTNSDLLIGDQGNDTLNGNGGTDLLREGRTAASTDEVDVDTFNGGADRDIASYLQATQGISISLDGVANDGRTGEGDNVKADVEEVASGRGADFLTGNAGSNIFSGGDGGDTMVGNEGADTYSGGAGADLLSEGNASITTDALDADTYFGGPGVDTVRYFSAQQRVVVDLDDVADDGRDGEGDNVRSDVENLEGGAGNDSLTGNVAPNRLGGKGGGDTLDGKAGDDLLRGEGGFDLLDGGTESDDCDVGANGGTETNCEI